MKPHPVTYITDTLRAKKGEHGTPRDSNEKETRELGVQPCKVFLGNPTMDSTFRIPGTGFRIPCQGNLDFGGFATQAKLM